MQITDYDYTGISSAVAAAQTQTVKQTSEQQQEVKKVQEVKTDSYEHVENSESLASIGIYDSNGRLAGTEDTEKQRSENSNTDSSEQNMTSKTSETNETEKSNEKNFAVKTEPSDKSAGGVSAPVTSSSDDDEESTQSKVVTINGESYLETTVIKDGQKTVTRKNLETGEVEVTKTKNS